MTVVLVGADDVIGRRLAPRLVAAGWELRVVRFPGAARAPAATDDVRELRDWRPASVASALAGATHLVWVLGGAPVPFAHVAATHAALVASAAAIARRRDALVDAVRAPPLERVLLVTMVRGPGLASVRLADAHARTERAIAATGVPLSVVRAAVPFGDLTRAVAGGGPAVARVVGDGATMVNPVHEADVADACVRAVSAPPGVQEVGGPDLVTLHALRGALADLTGAVCPPPLSLRSARWWRRWLQLTGLRWPSAARAEAFEYAVAIADAAPVAPRVGRRALAAYLARRLAGSAETREYAVPAEPAPAAASEAAARQP